MHSISLPTYDVLVQNGALASVGDIARAATRAYRYAVITDTNVAPLHGRRVVDVLGSVGTRMLTVPAGEASKTRETWASLTDQLLESGFARDAAILAVGGGVVGDLAGFVAATYMRGIAYVQVPTSLLAMIDASVGGKTAVDTPRGKNLVGAFHQPAAVVADPAVLATLPPDQFRSGLAEAIKHGVIADGMYLERIASDLPGLLDSSSRRAEAVEALVARSVEIKAEVVRRDERETGLRQVLNFGHTIGHAIESASKYSMLHGECVAIGMVVEAALAARVGVGSSAVARDVRRVVERAGLPTAVPSSVTADQIVAAMRTDKKMRSGALRFALPREIGQMASGDGTWSVPVDESLVRSVIRG
ncbi:MAG: 3-dehydroquinate synthase [Gemmatimonadaceae bacterium]